jgi:hypothetical protein
MKLRGSLPPGSTLVVVMAFITVKTTVVAVGTAAVLTEEGTAAGVVAKRRATPAALAV